MSKITMLYDNTNFDSYWDMAVEELHYRNDDYDECEEYSDSEILDTVYFLMDSDWDDLRYCLDAFFGDRKCIIFGTLGRWERNYNVWDTGTIGECLGKALSDCDYMQIFDADGHLYVEGCHHDGTNLFEIKFLKDSAQDYIDNWAYYTWEGDTRTAEDICKQLVKRHSLCPHFAKKRWDNE